VHRIRVDRERETAVVSAQGELDAYAAPDLSEAFRQQDLEGSLVVDLSRVSFMDSTALGLLVGTVNELAEKGGRARVVLPQTAARRIFEITTLDRVLPVSASRADALAELMEPERLGASDAPGAD
jgi:anti-sigma B factor antagonist